MNTAQPKVKTPSDLKFYHEMRNPASNYFERGTMRFFGDTMRNMSVSKVTMYDYYDDKVVECYQLWRKSKTSKGAPAGALACFDMDTFEVLHCLREIAE